LNNTDKQVGIHEIYSFEIDEFDFICGPNTRGNAFIEAAAGKTKQQTPFEAIFSDKSTASLHLMLLEHVRLTSETISYPYRCDTESHCVFLRAVVSKTSTMRVGFLNKVLGYEARPTGTRLVREFVTESADFCMCSICNRVNHNDRWIEFQQLVETNAWPANGKIMRTQFEACKDCNNSIGQRIAETKRSYDRKIA